MLLSKLAGQMIGCLEIHESMDLNQWVKVKVKESCLQGFQGRRRAKVSSAISASEEH